MSENYNEDYLENCVVLDTDVASTLYKAQRLPSAFIEDMAGLQTAVTFATIGEMTAWAVYYKWGPKAQKDLQRWLSTHHKIGVGGSVAECWGHLAAAERDRGRSVKENDTWIAACCIGEGLPLATLNRRDFVGFVSHHGLSLVGEERGEEGRAGSTVCRAG